MSSAVETLALAREQLGIEGLVAQLAAQDPVEALVAVEASLAALGDDELRRSSAKVAGLAAVLDGASPDDLSGLDLRIRQTALDRSRAQIWRISLATSREIGRRIAATEPKAGRPVEGAPTRANVARTFGLQPYRAGVLVELAELPPERFAEARDRGVELVEAGKAPPLRALLRQAASGEGEAVGDEWSTDPAIVEAIRELLGGEIGVDVASHLSAQAGVVRARRWYSRDDLPAELGDRELAWARNQSIPPSAWHDARAAWGGADALLDERPWYLSDAPTLFANPPYSRRLVARFADKLLDLLGDLDRVPFGWAWLVNLDASAQWQRELGELGPHCPIARRVSFLDYWGEAQSGNRSPQVVITGATPEAAQRYLGRLGPIYQAATAAGSVAHVVELAGAGRLTAEQVEAVRRALGHR